MLIVDFSPWGKENGEASTHGPKGQDLKAKGEAVSAR
jgi:hypothetical protein